jgi:hypothetical protein
MGLAALRESDASSAPVALRPATLLDESERLFSTDVIGALRSELDPGQAHRRDLVVQVLAAYERLRARQAPSSDPAAVFGRWPACTLVATAWLARSTEDVDARLSGLLDGLPTATWLAGWAAAWASRRELREHHDIPGLAALVALSGAARSIDTAPPAVRLDLERGAVVVDFGDELRGASVVTGGGECPRAATGFLLPRPGRIATCTDVLGGVHVVDVVDVRDPLVVFDEFGTRLSTSEPLPAGEVWILHLGEPAPEAVDGGWQVLEHAAPPVGWSRWWLGRVSLADTTAIRSAVDFGAGPRLGAWRPVASSAQADLVLGEPIEGLLGPEGEPVHSEPPRVRLPGGASQTWTLELHREGAALPRRWTAPGGTVVSLADGSTGPLVGRYQMSASAPGQAPVRAAVTLAQGVSLDTKYRVRILAEHGGLSAAKARLTGPVGIVVEPNSVTLRPHEIRRAVTIRTGGHGLAATVELPHCALRRRVAGENGAWGVQPEVFTLDDLAQGGSLDVRLPSRLREAMDKIPSLVAGDSSQRIRGSRVADGVYRYRLAEVADSVRADGSSLVLSLELGQDFTARVARVRGTAVAEGAIRRGDWLRLLDRDPAPELTVRVTSPITPWLPATEVTLAPGETDVALGAGYAHGGPLDVEVAAPHLARRMDRAFRIGDVRRVPKSLSGVEFQMAAYLAGEGPLPTGVAAFRLLWVSADAGGPARDTGSRALVAQDCAAALAEHPDAALVAGARTGLAPHRTIGVLVRSGLAAHRFPRVDRPEAITPLWQTSPLLSLLLTSPLLPYRSGAPDWDPAELTPEKASLLDAAERGGSPAGLELLTGVRPWDGPVPPQPVVEAENDPAPAAAPVPDIADDRAALRAFVEGSPFRDLFAVLARVRSPGVSSPRGASLGFALVARLAAHGDAEAAGIEPTLRAGWLAVTTADPGTAASDLALAEYLVSYWHAHRA